MVATPSQNCTVASSRKIWHFLWPEIEDEEDVPITYITNGVHTPTWMARRLRLLFDKYLGEGWLDRLDDPETWVKVDSIPDTDLWAVRRHLKRKLALYMLHRVRTRWMEGDLHPVQAIASGAMLDPNALTIGFARRFATYKRASLVFSDLNRLLDLINRPNRPVQIIFSGKAHPADEPGKMLIQEVYRVVKKAEGGGRLVFLEDYDMNLARYLVQGVDVWMNTPRRPNEASGDLRMKAALNGALNFSVLDGWWRGALMVQMDGQSVKTRIPGRRCRMKQTPKACTIPWKTRSSRCTTPNGAGKTSRTNGWR